MTRTRYKMTQQRGAPGGNPLGVKAVKADENHPDAAATRLLFEAYSNAGGFHCPWCQATITDEQEAVKHLAMEINKAWAGFMKGGK